MLWCIGIRTVSDTFRREEAAFFLSSKMHGTLSVSYNFRLFSCTVLRIPDISTVPYCNVHYSVLSSHTSRVQYHFGEVENEELPLDSGPVGSQSQEPHK